MQNSFLTLRSRGTAQKRVAPQHLMTEGTLGLAPRVWSSISLSTLGVTRSWSGLATSYDCARPDPEIHRLHGAHDAEVASSMQEPLRKI